MNAPFSWSRRALSPCKVWGRSYNARRLQVRKHGVCMFFLSHSESGAPCVRGVHSSYKHCVTVYCPILTLFSAFFSQEIDLSDALLSSHIRRQVAAQFSRKFKKSAEKFVRTTLYRWLRDLQLGPRMQMCTYINFFSAYRYIACVKIRISSPKTARNEQVCAHQKS